MLKNDRWIRENALKGMLEPFHGGPKVEGTVSFGVSAYGYDMRIADEFRVFQPSSEGAVIDPKSFDEGNFKDLKADSCLVPPNSYVLARSLEYFRIPRDVLAICFGKSTYARCGLLVNVTPLEPEWEGYVTISISNTTPRPVRIHSNEGIAQVLFLGAQELCETSYADKAGKYQAQKNITSPKA